MIQHILSAVVSLASTITWSQGIALYCTALVTGAGVGTFRM
jgi:hypothetical protein